METETSKEASTTTGPLAPPSRDRLWSGIIIALVALGVLMLVVPFLITARLVALWPGVQVLLVAVIVAAIRSRK